MMKSDKERVMVRLAVIDDNEEFLHEIERYVMEAVPSEVQICMTLFTAPTEVLNYVEENSFDILIADIEMPEMNGIELGKKLREKLKHLQLIFLTAYPEYAYEGYRIHAYQYIGKNEMEERLPGVMRRLLRRMESEKKKYRWIKTGNEQRKLQFAEILYVHKEKGTKYVTYMTVTGIYRERISMKELKPLLYEQGFIAIDRGYMVNIKHISGISRDSIRLDNEEELCISRGRREEMKKALSHQWRKWL